MFYDNDGAQAAQNHSKLSGNVQLEWILKNLTVGVCGRDRKAAPIANLKKLWFSAEQLSLATTLYDLCSQSKSLRNV